MGRFLDAVHSVCAAVVTAVAIWTFFKINGCSFSNTVYEAIYVLFATFFIFIVLFLANRIHKHEQRDVEAKSNQPTPTVPILT